MRGALSGGTPSTTEPSFWNGEIPWVSPKDFGAVEISETADKISETGRLAASLEWVPPDSVLLVVRSGILRHTLPVAVNEKPVTINQDLKALLTTERLVPHFLAEYMHVNQARLLPLICKHGATVQSVNTVELMNMLLPIPPLDIQRKLVAEMRAAREARKQKLREADEFLASLDSYLLETLGLTVPPRDNRQIYAVRLRDIPARFDPHFHHPNFRKLAALIGSQRHARLGELAAFSAEQWTSREGETFRYIEISGVNTETGEITPHELPVNEAPSRAQMVVHSGDLLISLTRPHHGAISIIDATLEGAIASTGFAVVRRIETERVRPDYLWCALHSHLGLQQMLQRSSGGNYPAITEAELSKVLIPLPSLQIQDQIAAEVRHRREKARGLRSQAEADWQEAKRRFEQQLLGTEQQ